jgi:hypothetical protein
MCACSNDDEATLRNLRFQRFSTAAMKLTCVAPEFRLKLGRADGTLRSASLFLMQVGAHTLRMRDVFCKWRTKSLIAHSDEQP